MNTIIYTTQQFNLFYKEEGQTVAEYRQSDLSVSKMSVKLENSKPPAKPADVPLRIYSNPICPYAQVMLTYTIDLFGFVKKPEVIVFFVYDREPDLLLLLRE